MSDHSGEAAHDRLRRAQFLAGEARAEGVDRRLLLRMLAATGAVGATGTWAAGPAAAASRTAAVAPAAAGGTVKPLPEEWFTVRGTNAETRFEALRDTGRHTPVERFFVRNHTSTPLIDKDSWSLRVWGSGLRRPEGTEFSYADLRRLPSVSVSALVECAGNGRSYFDTQQGRPASGTAWTLGAVGSARWRGVRLADVLPLAGVRRDAVDVQPRGLDADYVTDDGANLGRVRRPLPMEKALDDVVLAYEMNGEPLPADHGHPVRVLVPSWVGIASVKWVGDIEVSAEPLYSPWNTDFYRLFGEAYPPEGSAPLTRQTVKSAFEVAQGQQFAAGRTHVLTGRSWSGRGRVTSVEVSTDGGASWRPAQLRDTPRHDNWVRWSARWRPGRTGATQLLARATDSRGVRQPERTVANEQGYLFDAVVRHPVSVV